MRTGEPGPTVTRTSLLEGSRQRERGWGGRPTVKPSDDVSQEEPTTDSTRFNQEGHHAAQPSTSQPEPDTSRCLHVSLSPQVPASSHGWPCLPCLSHTLNALQPLLLSKAGHNCSSSHRGAVYRVVYSSHRKMSAK